MSSCVPDSANQTREINDLVLFDSKAFLIALDTTPSTLNVFKDFLNQGTQCLNDAFLSGSDVEELMHQRSWLIDQLLIHAWQMMIDCEKLALIAVGGYGRQELHPASDIDLLILKESRIPIRVEQQIKKFLAFLWDIGLEVGQSVRTVRECVVQSRPDVAVATNLMESRLLAGKSKLFDSIQQSTGPLKIWDTEKFFKAKLDEQRRRHAKYANTEYNLEPNIKEGPGGLRDIQIIGWVTRRHFNVGDLHDLVKHDFLTVTEYQILRKGQAFLWCIRYALHTLNARREDRLLFDYQHHVAEIFGFYSKDNSGVEQFMKIYYKMVHELSCLNEMLLQHFQEDIISRKLKKQIKPINKRFQIRNDYIEVCHEKVFQRYPFALLEISLLKQKMLSIKGVRASTIRLIRESIYLIDDNFRNDIRNTSLFMEILRQPKYVGHELRRMHRYGVLGKYLPAFGNIQGQMQFDLFHAYTVDEHTMFVNQNMRFFGLPEYADIYPLCHKILQMIPKQELLYLAGLFHDIAKGRGGDHSKLGVKDAVNFCKRHQLSTDDTHMVSWLVEHHLLLSKTAQRQDISDPEVINNFALKMGDREHLNYLYLLTVADVSATNPVLWNNWKDSLFGRLYDETTRALRRGLENPLNKKERIDETKNLTLKLLDKNAQQGFGVIKFWGTLSEDYFIHYSPDEIAWHIKSIAKNTKKRSPLITVRQQTVQGNTEIFIFMESRDHIFAITTEVLEKLAITIVDARIITSVDNFTLNTYIVLDKTGQTIKHDNYKAEIVDKLYQALSDKNIPNRKIPTPLSRKQKNFTIPTSVEFIHDQSTQRTIMEVVAADRIGLLSCIGTALKTYGIRLHNAKITTYGASVEDIFFITDKKNQYVSEQQLADLRQLIIATLA